MRTLFAALFAAAIFGGGSFVWGQEEGAFEKFDANKDGVISAEEAKERPLLERLLRTADKDGDKKLSKEEFQAGLKRRAEDGAPDSPKDQPTPRRVDAAPGPPRPDARYFEDMFGKWDANSDGKLTEDEVPKGARGRFKQFLERFDDDGDKALTKEQAPRFIMLAMQPPTPPEGFRPDAQMSEQLFRQWDANKDGKLTADEVPADRREQFNQILSRIGGEEKSITKEQFGRVAMMLMVAGPPGIGPGAMSMPPMAVLRALDVNNDGELSKEEIENAAKSLATLDKNEDGKLSREELMPGLAGGFPGGPFPGRPGGDRPDQPRPEGRPEGRPDARPGEGRPFNAEQALRRFKELDANSDGKISKEEAPEDSPIRRNFDRADSNGDGFVDEAEMKAMFQRGDGPRPEGRRRDGDRPKTDRPEKRRPAAEGDEKAKDKE